MKHICFFISLSLFLAVFSASGVAQEMPELVFVQPPDPTLSLEANAVLKDGFDITLYSVSSTGKDPLDIDVVFYVFRSAETRTDHGMVNYTFIPLSDQQKIKNIWILDPLSGFISIKCDPYAKIGLVKCNEELSHLSYSYIDTYYFYRNAEAFSSCAIKTLEKDWTGKLASAYLQTEYFYNAARPGSLVFRVIYGWDLEWHVKSRVGDWDVTITCKNSSYEFRVRNGVVTAQNKGSRKFVRVNAQNFKTLYKLVHLACLWVEKNEATLYYADKPKEGLLVSSALVEALQACEKEGLLNIEKIDSLLIEK